MYMQIVTITSQGQITLPAEMRRKISIHKYNKAAVSTDGKKIIIEPIVDLIKLGGLLKNKTIKRKNIDDIIALEEKAIAKMIK